MDHCIEAAQCIHFRSQFLGLFRICQIGCQYFPDAWHFAECVIPSLCIACMQNHLVALTLKKLSRHQTQPI